MIGVAAVAGAAARGADVIAVDISASKSAVAQRYGARNFIDAGHEDVAARVAELTSGDGVDVVIEAVGTPQTFTQAIDSSASLAVSSISAIRRRPSPTTPSSSI